MDPLQRESLLAQRRRHEGEAVALVHTLTGLAVPSGPAPRAPRADVVRLTADLTRHRISIALLDSKLRAIAA